MKTNILTLVITLVVGIILAGSLLAPVISDAQNTIGPEVTITNDSPIVLREVEEGDVLKVVRTVTGSTAVDVWTLNDEVCVGPTGSPDTWNVGVMSDGIYLSINASGNTAVGWWLDVTNNGTPTNLTGASGGVGKSYSLTFSDGMCSLADEDTTTVIKSVPYTWGYVLCPYGEGEYCSAMPNGVGIVKENSNVILCGVYTTGDLDTTYWYNNGTAFVGKSDYSGSATITKTLHAGTTDIYDANVSYTVTDGTNSETFTPYRILVPYEITGHEAGGASYTLIGAIPILVIVAILMVAVGAIALRRND